MAQFDPDAYLAKKSAPKTFDPDAYLASKENGQTIQEERPWYDVSAKGLLKGAIESLPAAGGLAGGALGFLSPFPGGTIVGGGVGAMAGESARRGLNKMIFDEEVSRPEFYKGLGESGVAGMAGEAVGPAIGAVSKFTGQASKRLSSSLTRIPEKTIETYIEKVKTVDYLIKKYGGDSSEMAADVRNQINNKIQKFKSIQNDKITKALAKSGESVDVSKTLETLNFYAKKLDPDYQADELAKIASEIELIKRTAPDNIMPAEKAFNLQKRLQDLAEYVPEGQFFKKKGLIEQGFKQAAADTRKIVNAAKPDIADANKNLQMLRIQEKRINRNLLRPDMPEASLLAAGEGLNRRNVKGLKDIGALLGEDILAPIEEISAARRFASPGLLPGMDTGAALIPLAIGGGAAVPQILQGDFVGAGQGLLAGALASPLALKYGIKGGRLASPILPSLEAVQTAAKPVGFLATKKAQEKKKKD